MKEGTYKEMKQNKAADQKKNEKKETMTEDVERAGKSLIKVEKRSETTNIFQFRMEWNGMDLLKR
jgi:hypothetical protein